MRYLAIVGLLAVLAAPALAADVTAKVTVSPYAAIDFPDGTEIALEVPDNATLYGPSGQEQTHGGWLHMSVNANYSAKVSFGSDDLIQCPSGTGWYFAKVTSGTNMLGVLPAIGPGYWELGQGVTCDNGNCSSLPVTRASMPGVDLTGSLPVGLNQFTLFISASMDQTPDGSLAPEGVYTGTLVVTVAP